MKKFILLFAILFSVIGFNANAQIVNCNASFTFTYLSPNNVKFIPVVNLGAPNVLHTWIFGDGTPDSTTVSPTHIYANNGFYMVKHVVRLVAVPNTTIVCGDTITMMISIGNTTACTLQSSFTSSSVASNNLVKLFTNTSVGAAVTDSIRWTFGDGTSANTYNAQHTYTNAGQYLVCLRIIKRNSNGVLIPTCANEICDSVWVNAPTPCVVQAAFNVVPYLGSINSLSQYFDNASTNILNTDSIRWTFGDGTSSSTFHAFHAYANYGTYNVCLRVIKRINGILQTNCVSEFCAPLTITAPPPPCQANVNFAIFPSNSSLSLLDQNFVNSSFNMNYTDSMRWSFGDGTYANTYNTTHSYANYGTYTVCFRVIRRINGVLDTTCIREICLINTIVNPNPPCTVQAAFTRSLTPGQTNPLSQYFTNTSTNIVTSDSIRWTFGDGTSANTFNANHIYANYGVYNVCLRVIKRINGQLQPNCVSEVCRMDTINAPVNPCANLQPYFTRTGDTTSIPSVIQFTNQSTSLSVIDNILWNFGDGTISAIANPVHSFVLPGVYNVCLTVVSAGCTKQICKTVTITQAPPVCNLVSNFTISPAIVTIPLTHSYINTSVGAASTDSIRWTFSDNTPASNAYNPTHTFANPGIYNVCLRIIKRNAAGILLTNCASEYCKLDTIIAPPTACVVQANFNIVTTAGTPNTNSLSQYFANTSTNIVASDSIRWTFGDGTTSSTFNATHTYTSYGIYNVCLRVIKRINGVLQPTCVSEYCKSDTIAAPPCTLQANFTAVQSPTTVNALTQLFTNTSTSALPTDSIRWTFGDGTSANTLNATHTYASYGIYNVCLRVIKRINGVLQPNCVSEYCRVDTILAPINPCASLQPYFTKTGDTAVVPSVLQFTNQSLGLLSTDSIRWQFGDGTFSTAQNPVHTYAAAGTYNVCLIIYRTSNTASTPSCVKEYCKLVVITQAPPVCNITASFNILPVTSSPLTKSYVNTSVGIAATDSIRWTFGDGTSSNQYSPTHTYASQGAYNVCLRIIKRNPNGVLQTNCVREFCKLDSIYVPNPCNLQAYFSFTSSSTTASAVVTFTNQSPGVLPTDTIRWTFGDGSTGTGANPVHTYANAGTYTACIRIARATPAGSVPCVREYCKTFTITAPPVFVCNISANFTWYRDSAVTIGNLYHFINTTIGASSTDSVRWSFGDGTYSTAANPTHNYAQTGPYQVCVRVQKRNAAGVFVPTCVSEKCYTVVIAAPTNMNCNNVTLTYTSSPDPLYQNRIRFTAVANAAILNQSWTITKMPITITSNSVIINQFNPTYAFLDSGYYRVCIKATFANNCIKEYCSVLHIANPTPTTNVCNLQLYPNPASTSVTGTVTLSQPLIMYAFIYNTQNMLVAQKIQQGAVGINNVPVNIANLPAGLYRYRLYYGFQSCVSTFMKQ